MNKNNYTLMFKDAELEQIVKESFAAALAHLPLHEAGDELSLDDLEKKSDKKVQKTGKTTKQTHNTSSDGDKKTTPAAPDKTSDPAKNNPYLDAHGNIKLGDVTLDLLISRLNLIRSGRSLYDKNIFKELQHYYDNLTDSDRYALWIFLSALTQVLGGIPGEDAVVPEKSNMNITFVGKDAQTSDASQSTGQPVKQAQAKPKAPTQPVKVVKS